MDDQRTEIVNGHKIEQYFHGADPIYIDNRLFNGTWTEAIESCKEKE